MIANSTNRTAQTGTTSDVALLIDYENLQLSLKRNFNVTTPKMSLIIQEAQEHGRLVLARAYAPWTSQDLSIDAENLYRQGIELIYVPTRKNSADVRLAVDAVETCGRQGNIGTYVIVTGDGDLIHPLNFLRQNGRRVVVIGVDAAMSRLLSAAADEVLLYERDLDPSVARRVQRAAPGPQNGHQQKGAKQENQTIRLTPLGDNPPPEQAFQMLRDALARRGNGEPVLYQELGHWLGQDFGLKPRLWYGVPFSSFMDAAEQKGVVALTTSGGNSYASLPAQATSSASAEDTPSDEDNDEDSDTETSEVRLESLQPEERRDLFNSLRELVNDPHFTYLTFRTILRHLMEHSVLPRLSEWQIRRLLNDLANRTPPILQRSSKTRKTSQGTPYTFATFTLTDDESLLNMEPPVAEAEAGAEA